MAVYTVGQLARSAGLARSTLLYHDRIGLLRPAGRSGARYRLYGEEARERLAAIRTYRDVGLGLEEIRALLDARGGDKVAILSGRLERLNQEIARLREQQRVIVRILRRPSLLRRARALDKRGWVAILAAAGLDDAAMHRWHVEFEALAPEAHADFLESLGIPPREVASIRAWSRAEAPVLRSRRGQGLTVEAGEGPGSASAGPRGSHRGHSRRTRPGRRLADPQP